MENVVDYAIFGLDRAGCVTSWNAGAERIKGYRPDEIIGQHFSRLYPPEDVQAGKCGRLLAAAARNGRSEDEGWRVRKGGARFWASVVINAVHDDEGKLVGYAKVTRDLTERRRVEDERLRLARIEEAHSLQDTLLEHERDAQFARKLLERERHTHADVQEARKALMTALSNMGDAIIATDSHGNVTLMTPAAERLTGWKLADARGQPLPAVFDIIDESTHRRVESPVESILRAETVTGLANHTVLISRTGVETPIHESGAPISDAVGDVCGVVLVFRDATATRTTRSP